MLFQKLFFQGLNNNEIYLNLGLDYLIQCTLFQQLYDHRLIQLPDEHNFVVADMDNQSLKLTLYQDRKPILFRQLKHSFPENSVIDGFRFLSIAISVQSSWKKQPSRAHNQTGEGKGENL